MGFTIGQLLIFLFVVVVPLVFFVILKPTAGEIENTWKFRTVMSVILAFVIPLWPVTLPLFLFLAYRSYKAGSPHHHQTSPDSMAPALAENRGNAQELAALYDLLQKGALTQAEFEVQKQKILGP